MQFIRQNVPHNYFILHEKKGRTNNLVHCMSIGFRNLINCYSLEFIVILTREVPTLLVYLNIVPKFHLYCDHNAYYL